VSDSITVVRIEDVSKRFIIRKEKSLKERVVNMRRSNEHKEDFWAIKDISMEISSGSTVGLIGPNGSGKSTLLKMIGGIIQPTTGKIERRGRLAALLELGAGFHPDLTGRENVYLNSAILGVSKSDTEKLFDAIVDFSGIEKFIDTQVKFYSSGMYIRLAFAVAVHVDPDILLVDEVLAVGDEPFQRKCMDRIRSFQHEGRTIVLVTHALDQVAELCDRALVLEHGHIVHDGDPREALRRLRSDFEITRQEDIERERISETDIAVARAKITAIEILDTDLNAMLRMPTGGTLDVAITIEATEPLDDWMIGIGINTPLGQVVYGTNTKLLGLRLAPLIGRQTFHIRLPNLWLGEGHYTVVAALSEYSGVEIDVPSEGAPLEVMGNGNGIGYLYLRPELLEANVSIL
jgi:ABC-2 type transport system ATP-binding protein